MCLPMYLVVQCLCAQLWLGADVRARLGARLPPPHGGGKELPPLQLHHHQPAQAGKQGTWPALVSQVFFLANGMHFFFSKWLVFFCCCSLVLNLVSAVPVPQGPLLHRAVPVVGQVRRVQGQVRPAPGGPQGHAGVAHTAEGGRMKKQWADPIFFCNSAGTTNKRHSTLTLLCFWN